MKVIRRNEETNDIDERSPFLERSIPVTRSPKVSGAGVQLRYIFRQFFRCYECGVVSIWHLKSGQEMKILSGEPRLQLAPKV